ncbi:MAG: hypothetical protein ACOCXA_06925 [Planctomycetota bacterium]
MTHAAAQLGRQPMTVLEMDLRQRISGVDTPIIYRLCSADLVPPPGLDARPVIERVQTLPTRLDIGESLGMRAAISIQCRDFINDGDVAGGPAARDATFWRLLKARVPYVANRPARIITGYLIDGVFIPERTLHYLLVRIDGPDRQGMVTIHLTDALIRTENRKAQAPGVGTGTLLAGIAAEATTATIAPSESADDYRVAGYLRIGDSREIIGFSRIGTTLALQRGQLGTIAEAHVAGDTIQEIVVIQDATLAEVTRLLVVEYAGIDPDLIDWPAWQDEDDAWLGAFRVSAIIWDPTGVATLLQELTQQFPFFIVYDARVPRLDFQAIKPSIFNLVGSYNERDHLLRDSIEISEDHEKRVSQIWFYFGVKDPSGQSDDPRNFQRLVPFIDREAESDYGDKRIRKVFSRWLPADRAATVLSIAERMLLRLRDGRQVIAFHLDAKDGEAWVGDNVEITTRHLIDTDGVPRTIPVQIIEAKEQVAGTSLAYQAETLRFASRYCLYTSDEMPLYQRATPAQRARYGFYADDDDLIGGTDPAYLYL